MDSKIFLRRYRVSAEEIEAIGKPGDSLVTYEGEEIDSGKKMVVEVVPAAALTRAMREQLEAEAIAAKKLTHLNIPALYDFGVENDNFVYVTEDFDGTPAEQWVNTNGPMPVGPVLRIASQVVSALGAAAFHRIVHRAINPSNLVLVPGQTAEGEWPLVKILHFVGGAPRSGTDVSAAAFGKSLPYASPEQLKDGAVDFRSEVYSLGATMWFLLTGAPPPIATSGPMMVQPTPPGLAGDKMSGLSKEVRRFLAQMLSANPEARPRDPLAFYRQIQNCLTKTERPETMSRKLPVPVSRIGPIGMQKKSQRTPLKTLMRATLFLTMTALAAWFLRGYVRDRRLVHAEAPIGVPIGITNAFASATPAPTAVAVQSPPPSKPGPSQQPAESPVKVTLVSFTPMVGRPGAQDFKIATLTVKIEASVPVTVTEASFYVDSAAFNEGPGHNVPITLLVHTGIFLGPPGSKVDPEHPIQRTIWLKSQENLFPNWSFAYDQTEDATFRWTIGGQPVGGSVVKPLHKAWRRAESAEPEIRRAEPAHPEKEPDVVLPHTTASHSQETNPAAPTERSRDDKHETTKTKSREVKRTDSEPTILLKVPRDGG